MERPIFPEQQVWAGLSSSPQRLRLVPVLAPEKKLRVPCCLHRNAAGSTRPRGVNRPPRAQRSHPGR